MADHKGIGISMIFFTLLLYVVILAIFPPGKIGGILVLDWPEWAALIVVDAALGIAVGLKVLGSGLTGASEILAFYAATTGPLFLGMSTATWLMFSLYQVPLNGFLQAIIGVIYGFGLFFVAGEQGGGSGTS